MDLDRVQDVLVAFAHTPDALIWAAYPDVTPEEDARTDDADCLPMSRAFQAALREAGIDSTLVNGVDGNDGEVWTHWWVRVGDGVNIDWTARQFYNLVWPRRSEHQDLPCPLIWRDGPHPIVAFSREEEEGSATDQTDAGNAQHGVG
jgi:hypothetical protein